MREYYAVIVAALAVVVAGASVKEPECPTSHAARIPHLTDCTLYYICQDGKGTLHECPDGLHFNNAIKQCDWPPAGCISDMSRPQTQPNLPDSPLNCIGTCPKDGKKYLRYRADCHKYCMCSHGTPIVMSCAPEFYFNMKTTFCDFPWRVTDCPWSKGYSVKFGGQELE